MFTKEPCRLVRAYVLFFWFGCVRWMEALDTGSPSDVSTYIIQELASGSDTIAPSQVAFRRFLHVSTVIKADNRRKHNSHEWYVWVAQASQGASYLCVKSCLVVSA
eukprot:scaffold671943_cov60-Prasinocladus_malaysianus.AAC.1